jgi:hypothetical protein
VPQPAIAFGEHVRDELEKPALVAVDVQQQRGEEIPFRLFDLLEQHARGRAVQRARTLADAQIGLRAREQRQSPREAQAQRVDRLHLQPCGILGQTPAPRAIALERR